MPRYVLTCIDKPDSLALRMATREAHLDYVRAHSDSIRAAGPLLDETGNMNGSLFLIDAPEASGIEAFSLADPYRQAGLFDRVEIRLWRQTLGTPI